MSYSTTATDASLTVDRRPVDPLSILILLLFLAISAAVAVFGSITTISEVDGWYADAAKVAWSPPNWLFGPVWTVLYAAMAVAAWLVWRRRHFYYVGPALTLYVGQLFLNSVWTPLFFGGYAVVGDAALWMAVAVIVLLDICVAACIAAFWPISRVAGLLFVPYLLWVLFATTLNIGVAVLNT